MRTAHPIASAAHLIVLATAFAVWLTACVVYFTLMDDPATGEWYLYGPLSILPAGWCVCAGAVSRRAGNVTTLSLLALAVPVLLCGFGIALLVVGEIAFSQPSPGTGRYLGMGVGMVGPVLWLPAFLFGLTSFTCAVVLRIHRALQGATDDPAT